jgi:hypothetical protein
MSAGGEASRMFWQKKDETGRLCMEVYEPLDLEMSFNALYKKRQSAFWVAPERSELSYGWLVDLFPLHVESL